MEYWDLYSYDGKKKNKIAIRGDKLGNDDFHLVVNAWIMNENEEFLITQRASTKSHPLMWECTGGSAILGENSLQAAIREVKEELGIDISADNGIFIGASRRFYESCPDILHVWLFKIDGKNINFKIQKEEVNDVMWASRDKILQLFDEHKFEPNSFFDKIMNINFDRKVYYIGFNANNAICNENFIDGAITLNPNKEKGNIYYTKKVVKDRTSVDFINKYRDFLIQSMENITRNHENVLFLAFNKKIKKMLESKNDFNIIGEKNYLLLDKLNDKRFTREMLNRKIPIIDVHWINNKIGYSEAIKLTNSNKLVIQGKTGAGGNNTFYIENEHSFNKYSTICNNEYYVSKYMEHLPINITIVIGKCDTVIFPPSIQLIKLEDDKFKYMGADFIYYQNLSNRIHDQVKAYSDIIVKELRKMDYRGILGIDFIADSNDNVYFMEINPRFQSSSFIISQYLSKYCSTSIAELHYLAITDNYIGNIYLDKIDNSFVNCTNLADFSNLKYYKIIKNGYYSRNKTSNFRKVFNYSIINHNEFEKRRIDSN